MKTESWQAKFYRLAEKYMEVDGTLAFVCGEIKRSSREMSRRFTQLTDAKQEALQQDARELITKIIAGEAIDEPKPLRVYRDLKQGKDRKKNIVNKVLEIENE